MFCVYSVEFLSGTSKWGYQREAIRDMTMMSWDDLNRKEAPNWVEAVYQTTTNLQASQHTRTLTDNTDTDNGGGWNGFGNMVERAFE